MTEKRKSPALRFRGYTDDWEQRKLGDIFEEYSEKDHAELPALTIIQGGGTIRRDESDRALQYDKKSLSNYKKVDVGDFIVHLRSFEGGLEMATNTGIVSPAYHIFHGEKVDSRFYYSYFRSKQFINTDLKPHVYGIRDGRSIDIEGMKTIEIPWTILDEQKAIGNCIDTLDHLITLHQRKLEKLKLVKKSMLEKMFPKNGSSVPEIRFKGFTDDWEQRKLIDEVASIDTGKSNFTPQESGQYEILGSTSVIGYDDTYDYEGDFLLTARVGANAGELYRYSGKVKISDNTVFIKGEQLDFVYYALLHFDIKRLSFGTGQPLVKASELKVQEIMMPVEDTERTVIGEYFANLDNLITLHQRKVEKLKILKKSMLEKMFV